MQESSGSIDIKEERKLIPDSFREYSSDFLQITLNLKLPVPPPRLFKRLQK